MNTKFNVNRVFILNMDKNLMRIETWSETLQDRALIAVNEFPINSADAIKVIQGGEIFDGRGIIEVGTSS